MTKQAGRLCRKGCNCNLQDQEYRGKVSVYCGTPLRVRETIHPTSGACLLANLREPWLFHTGNWKIHLSFKKRSEPAGGKVHFKPCSRGGMRSVRHCKGGDECVSCCVKQSVAEAKPGGGEPSL